MAEALAIDHSGGQQADPLWLMLLEPLRQRKAGITRMTDPRCVPVVS